MTGVSFLGPTVRIIMPIHNALFETRRAVQSIVAHTHWPYRLSLFDDGSADYCHNELEKLASWAKSKYPFDSNSESDVELITQPQSQGFVFTCNRGFSRYDEEFVILINSDVIVTPYWLTRLVLMMQRDDSIACLMPLSNEASFHSFSIPPGWNTFQLADNLAQLGRSVEPIDLVTAVGFCLLLRRKSMPQPLFDPRYSPGYGEESHLSMWLRKQDHKVLAAPNTFVYHCGRASFPIDQTPFMDSENYQYFMKNWQDDYHKGLKQYQQSLAIQSLRQRYPEAPAPGFRASLKLIQQSMRRRGLTHTLVQGASKSWAKLRSSIQARGWSHTLTEVGLQLRQKSKSMRRKRKSRFVETLNQEAQRHAQVVFLFEELNMSGGVQLILSLVDHLISVGIDARIAVHKGWPVPPKALWRWPFEPIYYESATDLKRQLPSIDIAVSTLWSTAFLAKELERINCALHTLAFVQDDEQRFYSQSWTQKKVIESYKLAQHTFVTSPWLKDQLSAHDTVATVVTPGIHRDDFFPSNQRPDPLDQDRPIRITALARPSTPRRGFRTLLRVFKQLEPLPVTTISVGSEKCRSILKNSEVHGFLKPKALREVFQQTDIFVDFSQWQAFGLPAFEAMACGAAIIGPKDGGLANYTQDRHDILLCESESPDSYLNAIKTLIADRSLLQTLQQNSLKTAEKMDSQRFFEQFISEMKSILGVTDSDEMVQHNWQYKGPSKPLPTMPLT